jgi:hypothetical protein
LGLPHGSRASDGGMAMDGTCQLATRGDARAFFVPNGSDGGDLWVVATGQIPTPCWDVRVDRSQLDIWPPQFAVVACPVGGLCPEVVTPYSAVGRFSLGSKPATIQVTDVDGSRDVSVDDAPDAAQSAGGADGTVVGSSRAVSLEEAISRAASQLPRPNPNVGVSMTIDEIWYTDGGFVGPVLYVRGKPKT